MPACRYAARFWLAASMETIVLIPASSTSQVISSSRRTRRCWNPEPPTRSDTASRSDITQVKPRGLRPATIRAIGPEVSPTQGAVIPHRASVYGLCQPLRVPKRRAIASERVEWLLSMRPRTAEVTVFAPGFLTPRMDMQRCSASTTTMTPRGLSF